MATPIGEALKETGLDYPAFLAHCLKMDLGPREIYPAVEPVYVAAIKAIADQGRLKAEHPIKARLQALGQSLLSAAPAPPAIELGHDAGYVLDKMARQRFFGEHRVKVESLQNNFCKRIQNVRAATDELEKAGLLRYIDGGNNPACSLIGKRSREIEEFVKTRDAQKGAA